MRISFTNHSKETKSVYIVRRPNGSLTDVELFSKVKIAPEQTVTRASYLEKDEGDFARTLTWCMAGGTVTNVDVVVDSFWANLNNKPKLAGRRSPPRLLRDSQNSHPKFFENFLFS